MKTVLSIFKFAAGFISNCVCQLARAACNGALSVFMALSCITTAFLSLLQFIGGGKNISKETASKAFFYARSSIAAAFAFLCQTVAAVSFIGPLVRGAQACSEKIKPEGIYSPTSPNRNFWQVLFGLNSWEQPTQIATIKPEPQQKKTAPTKQVTVKQITKAVQTTRPKKQDWDFLVEQYLSCQTIDQMNKARKKMALRYPSKYRKAMAVALSGVRKNT